MKKHRTKERSYEGLRLAEAVLADAFDAALTEKFYSDQARSDYLNAILAAYEAARTASKAWRLCK